MRQIPTCATRGELTRLLKRTRGGIYQGTHSLRDYEGPVVAAEKAIHAKATELGFTYHTRNQAFE